MDRSPHNADKAFVSRGGHPQRQQRPPENCCTAYGRVQLVLDSQPLMLVSHQAYAC